MTSFWPEFQQTETLVPTNATTPRKTKNKQTKKKRKQKKKRKNTYLVDGAFVEGFAPHERCAPFPPHYAFVKR